MSGVQGLTALVVGGAGFIGSRLVRRLLEGGAAGVRVVDNLLSAEAENLPADGRLAFKRGSITDDAVLAGLADEFDLVFHLATYHGNQSSIHDPLADHANNTLTTLKLYERLKDLGRVRKVVYSSAGCSVAAKTFGKAEATVETDLVSIHQDSPYSMSKIFGEFYSSYYFRAHGLPVVRARFQNVYGPGEVLGAGQWRGTPATVWRNVTPTFIYKALDGQPLPLENGGAATRDFIYVDDIVEGLVACALKGTPGEAYNLASGVETTILELATRINELTGNPAGVNLKPRRHWDNSGCRYGSTDKARAELGFSARVPLALGLERTVAWTRENLPFIRACMARHREHMGQ